MIHLEFIDRSVTTQTVPVVCMHCDSPKCAEVVFPLEMYTVCTFRLSEAINLPVLMIIPYCFLYVALTAWGITFAAMLYSLITARSTP